jgi:Protein of unknown function (DUF2806)
MEVFPLAKTDLGPAAKALVEKIASATGTLYAPLGTVFQALADVTADKIRTEGEIEVERVRRRALERLAAEETRKQNNLEAIYGQTCQLLGSQVSGATIEQMDEDWIVYHSEKARLVSDKEMQTLWARVMADEAEVPGSIFEAHSRIPCPCSRKPKRIFLHQFADLLSARILWQSRLFCMMTALYRLPDVYMDVGVDATTLLHLSTIGLVHYTSPMLSNNVWSYDGPIVELEYFGNRRRFVISKDENTGEYSISFGVVALTKVGQQLARIAGAKPIEGFLDFLDGRLCATGKISRTIGSSAVNNPSHAAIGTTFPADVT